VRVVATAGHVDHGKSSLIRALTGTDPDRFPEEKTRGLTIDLGFAFTTLPSGTEVGFVDVPGHERFVKNMLAGVGAVDVALFVVAAGEGWMPQSEEHLQILGLLDISAGLVAITKADAVAPEAVDVTQREVAQQLTTSSMRNAPVVVCDSVSGRGLDLVRTTLDAVLASIAPPTDRARPRLWIDRVFAARGAGTVVTGTLVGGPVELDDTLRVVRSGQTVRIRGIESAHRPVKRIDPGTRVALNLAGVDRRALGRGDALVREGQWVDVTVVDVEVQPVTATPARLPARLQAAVGSGEHAVRVRVLDEDTRLARLQFEHALPLSVGDRIVLRDPARARTIAGAVVLDVQSSCAPAVARTALQAPLVPRLLAGHGWLRPTELANLANLDADGVNVLVHASARDGRALVVGEWLAPPGAVEAMRAHAHRLVDAHHDAQPWSPGLELPVLATALESPVDQVRAALGGDDTLTVESGVVRAAERSQRASDTDAGRALLAQLDATPFRPPVPTDRELARALVREGTLIDVDGVIFTASAVAAARARLRDALAGDAAITVGQARAVLDSSRKYVVPLLERFDREGFTRRRGDVRIAGPGFSSEVGDQL